MKGFLRSKLVLSLATLFMIAATIGILFSSPRSAFAAFSLDPTYGNGGKVITSFGYDAYAASVALQTDGKAVVGGGASNGSYYNCELARYNANGSLDASFGTNGTVTQDFGMNCAMYPDSLAIQSDGKIVAAEESYNPGFFWRLVRYNNDGSVDTSFGNNGIVATAMMTGDHDIPYALTIQPTDQKIIVVGWTATTNDGNESLAVVRYNPDGSLDQTFGNGGEVITKIAGSLFIRGKGVTLQQDGKIVVYGDLTYGGSNTLYVTRFNSDGSFDITFGYNGYVTDQSMNNPGAETVTLQSDGKIVVDGVYSQSGQPRTFVIRYNADGSHDTSFGSGGYVLNPFAASDVNDSPGSFLIQLDGKIIFGGSSYDGSNQYFALRRLNADGSVDTGFGTNGSMITPMGAGGNSGISTIAQQPDGKIISAGFASNGTYNDWALARYVNTTNQNQPASINALSNVTINEGDTYSANGSFTDLDSSSWTATVDYGDGSGSQPLTLLGTNFSLSHIYKEEGTYIVVVAVTDNQGATGTGTATVTVNNALFSIGAITIAPSPVQVNNSVTATANFTDPGDLDTHTASWNWGDGNTTTGTVIESNGSGSVSNTHTYTTAGLYPVTLTVTDDHGLSATSTYQYVAVYDPTKSINGTGHMQSPAGALTSNPSQTGVLQFQMNGQYNTGHSIPSGNVQFNFNAGNFNFHLTTFKWIVVSGNTVYLEGTGKVNGSGSYTVFESATTTSPYKLRIQVTDTSNNVLYDNQPGAALTAQPTETISDGSITVQ